mgnify:FL=1|jgi:aspartate kinase
MNMNNLIVCKFGGSSLLNSSQFRNVKAIMEAEPGRRVLVPSAPGKGGAEKHKVTDLLLMCYQLASHNLLFDEIFNVVRERFIQIRDELGLAIRIEQELDGVQAAIAGGAGSDFCASRGEYLCGKLLADYLGFRFVDAETVIRIRGGKADVEASSVLIRKKIGADERVVVPGFYGINEKGEFQTFSRGGSDITGAIMAAGMEASVYENWTDVSGFLAADPAIVAHSARIKSITYNELRELSYMGAMVLHEEAIFPVRDLNIPIHIKNTNIPEDVGTLIVSDSMAGEREQVVTGISGKIDYTVVRVEKTHMSEEPSFYRKLLSVFETNDIPIEHMPTSIDTISVVVATALINAKEKKIREEISIYCDPDRIVFEHGLAVIAVVGRGMISTKGTSAMLFTALAENGINVRMISQGSSEMNIIVGVSNEDFENAIRAIHDKFMKG